MELKYLCDIEIEIRKYFSLEMFLPRERLKNKKKAQF